MQSPITLPPLVIRPDSPLPNPPGPTPGYIAKPIPWNGTTIEVAEFDNFFKRNDIRYERLTLSVIFTIATLQKSIEESYTGYSSNLTPALDSEINTFIGTGALSPLDWMKTAKYVIDLLAEKSKNDLASNTATANIFYGRHPFNKDIKKNAVDFVNILQIPGNKEPSIDIYKKWTTSITAAYQEKLLPERIRILTEKSHLLTASIAAVEAQEQQDIWRALAAWSIRYNDSKKPIIHQYNVDKSNVVQRIQSELDRAVLEIGPSTALTSVQLANKRIITAKQLIDEKDRALQIHISLLANYPDRDFKKTDLNDFLERSTTYNPPNSELAFVDEVNAIKSAYGADVLMDEISSLQAHLPTLYAAHAKAEAELIVAANLFRLPGVIAATRPVITTSTGTIAVIEGAALTLQTAIRIAITSLTDFLASVSPGFFVGVAALIYSPKLANGELPEQYAFSTPLSDLIPNQEKDLEAIATAGGTVELPYRISSKTAADGRSEAFVVKTDGVFVPSKVKVVSTVYNTNQNLYTATTTDTPPRTLTWTPIVNPETNPTTSPAASPVPAIYTGATVTPVQGRIDTFPAVSEGSFDDYVLVFSNRLRTTAAVRYVQGPTGGPRYRVRFRCSSLRQLARWCITRRRSADSVAHCGSIER